MDGEFQVQEEEPSTIEEVIAIIGEEGVVTETTSNLRYRNKYPRVYKAVSKAVVDAGYPRAVIDTKVLKDKTERKVYESENDHLRAFLNGRFEGKGEDRKQIEAAPEGSRETLQALFNQHATEQPLYVKGERAGGGGKVSQQAMETANSWFAAGDDVVEERIATIEGLVSGYKVGRDSDGAPTPESCARGIQALQKQLQKNALAQAAAALAPAAKV